MEIKKSDLEAARMELTKEIIEKLQAAHSISEKNRNSSGLTLLENALSVVGPGLAGKNFKIQYTSSGNVCADLKNRVIFVPRFGFLDDTTRHLLRTAVYHESSHVAFTNHENRPQGVLGEIANALEDCRIEEALGKIYPGAEIEFNWAAEWYGKKAAEKFNSRNQIGKPTPLMEALIAMMGMTKGKSPKWTPSEQAQKYISAAYPTFAEVRHALNTDDVIELAKRIYEILKEEKRKQKNENNQDENNQDENKNNQLSDGFHEDMPDKEKSKKSKSGPSGKNEGEEEESGKEDGQSEEEENEDSEGGEGTNQDNDEDEDSEEKDEDENENEEDSEEESKEEKEDNEIEDDEDNEDEGENSESKNQNSEEDFKGSDGDAKKGDDASLEKELSDETESMDKMAVINEAIQSALDKLSPEDKKYTACRDLDEVEVPNVDESDDVEFVKQRNDIAVNIMAMRRALEQALLSLAKSRKSGSLDQGFVDFKQLVNISKSLSKSIFYRIKEGITLNAAVSIVIDESGSMHFSMSQVRRVVIAFGEVLRALNIPFEVVGTSTKYSSGSYNMPVMNGFSRTNPIIYKMVKQFPEDWTRVRSRAMKLSSRHHNIDGEVIEFAAARLNGRREKRKIIISICDGLPESGHGNNELMASNLKNVCDRVRQNGIEVYGFGINTDSPACYYGREYFIGMQKEMGAELFKTISNILTQNMVKL